MIRGGIRRAFWLALRRRDRWERDVEDEIKLHLTLRAEQLASQGAPSDAAYAEAVRKFGPLSESRARLFDAARHRERTMRPTELFLDLRQDVSFALRTLARQKGWTAITILTLALGIGATTAVFSVVSSLLLHAVTYPHADRVMVVDLLPNQGNNTGIDVTITTAPPVFEAWRSGSRSFERLEPYVSHDMPLRTEGDPVVVSATRILPTFPQFAGVRPVRGRLFSATEMATRAKVALLSETLWRSRYAADESILGRVITLGDSAFTVIGVLPASLRLPTRRQTETDVWLPLDLHDNTLGLWVVGRLRPNANAGSAMKELDSLAARSGAYANGKVAFVARVRPPAQMVSFHDSLLLLTGAVALVLLVACANVAHLMLARAASRQRELAIRTALGAGRARLFRQLLTESLVISFSGAAAGTLLGWLGLHALIALRPSNIAELSAARLDMTTLLVTASVAVLSGVSFGVLGALQSSRQAPNESLKAGALSTSHSRGHERWRALLVTSEMALSAMLIVGATLLVRSVSNLQRTDLGFQPRGLYSIDFNFPKGRYKTPAARAEFLRRLTTGVRGLRGVRDVVFAGVSPGSRSFSIGNFEVQNETPAAGSGGTALVDVNDVDPRYFQMMGIRIVEGAAFTDTSAAANQVVVNEGFARAHWKNASALGHRVRVAYQGQGEWKTIVGVAADASTSGPTAASTAPLLYSATNNAGEGGGALMVRTTGNVDITVPARALIRSIEPQMTPRIQSTESIIAETVAAPRFTMLLLAGFTMLALVLAGVGLYGVMAYSVAQRTREIGIRIALGATRSAVARIVVVRGVTLALLGAGVGLVGAYWGTRLLVKFLFGVAPLDAASFATGAVVLIGAAVLACVVPTRRALAVDPILAIRAD